MKMMYAIFLATAFITTASCQEQHTVKVTVTEEDGTLIQGVDTMVTFLGYHANQTTREEGVTDARGVFEARGAALLRMNVRIEKSGYYKTSSGRLSRKKDHDMTFVLRKKKNPIPLYAQKFRGKIPDIGNTYGFDFEVGDWVTPHGRGKKTDIFFKVNIIKDTTNKLAGELEISFPHEQEGFVSVNRESGYIFLNQLPMPNEALETGYRRILNRIEAGYENKTKPIHTSYFFRTRAKKIGVEKYLFNYSKLKDGLSFVMGGGRFLEEPYRRKYPVEYGSVEFTYYYNPTPNDRNLEFDPKRNLFKSFKIGERVNDP